MTEDQAALLSLCPNAMSFYNTQGDYSDMNALLMRHQKAWYGSYANYNDSNAKQQISDAGLRKCMALESAFSLFIPEDGTSDAVKAETAEKLKQMRLAPSFPLFLFDLFGDTYSISRIIGGSLCFLDILETGSIRTQNGTYPPAAPGTPLLDIFKTYLPAE